MKKDNKKEEKGIVESFLGEMPMFGDFFRELGKIETFKKRFGEVDKKIEENLKKGEKKKWGFEANISVRPIINKAREDTHTPEISLHEDYFYGKKNHKLILAVKVPREEVKLKMKYRTLRITSDGFEKKIELPAYYRYIKKKQYKNGILVIELTK